MALKLEGITRGTGKHAGGVVIAPTKLTDFSPLLCDEDGSGLRVQYDKNDIEDAGLVKFDFLGLRTLTIIDWALEMVDKVRAAKGEGPLNIDTIPLDDVATFDMLKKAETTAVFQLESRGMKELIKRLLPDSLEDMIAWWPCSVRVPCSRAWSMTSSTASTAGPRSPILTPTTSMSCSSRCSARPTASSCIRSR